MGETECVFCKVNSDEPIFVLGRAVCPECEGRLTRLNVGDPDYTAWISVFRLLWEKRVGTKSINDSI